MTSKNCTKCKELKPLSDYHNDKWASDGVVTKCKPCCAVESKNYCRTKQGLIKRIFCNQRARSVRSGWPTPDYTLSELREWVLSKDVYHDLHGKWVESGFDKYLTPSLDRNDDYRPYVLSNLTVMTFGENLLKVSVDIKNGINNKISVPVKQFTMEGDFIKEYYSAAQAGRELNISQGHITSCCKGAYGRKSTGGFKWGYA